MFRVTLFLLVGITMNAQAPSTPSAFVRDLGHLQVITWTSPAHAAHSAQWLLPIAAITAGLLATDHASTRWVEGHATPAQVPAKIFGDASVAWIAGAPLAFASIGILTHDTKARNAGLLSGLALASAEATATGLKYVFMRQRPTDGGRFWQPRLDPSFPSQHAAGAWAVSTVLAHVYPRAGIPIYAVAAVITVSRWLALKHHPSDLLIGSLIGFGTGLTTWRQYK